MHLIYVNIHYGLNSFGKQLSRLSFPRSNYGLGGVPIRLIVVLCSLNNMTVYPASAFSLSASVCAAFNRFGSLLRNGIPRRSISSRHVPACSPRDQRPRLTGTGIFCPSVRFCAVFVVFCLCTCLCKSDYICLYEPVL